MGNVDSVVNVDIVLEGDVLDLDAVHLLAPVLYRVGLVGLCALLAYP